MLARIARDQQRLTEALEWLERAVDAPAPTVEAARGLLYELGDTLEAAGEDARALAVFLELQSTEPEYRAGRASGARAAGPGRAVERISVSVLSRLIFLAYFVEVGLLLLVVPWSPFWDRNYFVQVWPALETLTRSNLIRGAVSGLGVLNLWAAMSELGVLFGMRRR
jgi:hypothetical protein